MSCCVVGRIQNVSYESSDGTKRYTTEITANDVEFLSTKNSNGTGDSPKPSDGGVDLTPIDDDDDSLPF